MPLLLIGCGKKIMYPEGGEFRGNPINTVLGTYRLQKYMVDGVDSTDYYNTVCGRTQYKFVHFNNTRSSRDWLEITFFDKNIVSFPGVDSVPVGGFTLFDEYHSVGIGGHMVSLYFQIGPFIHIGNGTPCIIKKLTDSNFFIECDAFSKHYRFEFVKIAK